MAPRKFVMPRSVSYVIPGGVPVYYVDAIHKAKRIVPGLIKTFILHDTDGIDSRQELYDSHRSVSVHWLVGRYSSYEKPIAIKYASERDEYTYGAGFGSIGGIPSNLNPSAIQFEIEYGTMDEEVLEAYASVVAFSLRNWATSSQVPVLLPHWAIDARKSDPRFHWTDMLSRIYAKYAALRAK